MSKLYETKILDGWFQIMERLPSESRNARSWPAVWQEARAQGRTVLTFTFPTDPPRCGLPSQVPHWEYKDHGVIFDADAFEREMYGVYVNELPKGDTPVSFVDWVGIFRSAPVVTTEMAEWLTLYKESQGIPQGEKPDKKEKVKDCPKETPAKTTAKRSQTRKRPLRATQEAAPVVKAASPA